MALESATFISQLVPANPPGSDLKSQGDDHLRLIKSVLQNCFPDSSKAFYFPKGILKSANYSVVEADDNTLFSGDSSSGSFTFTLPSMAGLDAGWKVGFFNEDSTGNTVTVSPASGTIDGLSSIVLGFGDFCLIWLVGSSWHHVRVSGLFSLASVITPAQITASQNDYNPTGFDTSSVERISSDAAWSITGLAGGTSGRIHILHNIGSFDITLPKEDANSVAANRFDFDLVLRPDWSAVIWYDGVVSRWKQIALGALVGDTGDYVGNITGRLLVTDKVWDDAAPSAPAFTTPLTLDLSTAFDFIIAATSDFTLNFPSNVKAGQKGVILVVPSGGTWAMTLEASAGWRTIGGGQITLTGGVDLISYFAESASIIHLILSGPGMGEP